MGFWTRALDKITPWRRSGEVQRDQQAAQAKKKKKEEEEARNANGPSLSVGVAQPNQNIVVNDQQQQRIQANRPENLFTGLQQNLKIGQPSSVIPALDNRDTTPAPVLKPGAVVKPTVSVTAPAVNQRILVNNKPVEDTPEDKINRGLDQGKSWEDIAKENNFRLEGVKEYSQATRPNYGIKIAKPKQGFWNKVRDQFDANTEADKYRRQEGNRYREPGTEEKPLTLVNPGNIVSRTPIVGHVTKMLNTAGAQIAELPATVDGQIQTKMYSDLSKKLQEAKKNGNQFQVNEINGQLDRLLEMMDQTRREQEAGHTMFEKNKGGLFNAGTLYDQKASEQGKASDALKDIALPTAVTMLDLYTLGKGSAISDAIAENGLKQGVRVAAPNIVKAGAGNYASGDLGARAEGATGWDPIKAGAINSVLGTVPDIGLPAVTKSFKNRVLPKIFSGRKVNPADLVNELDDSAISASAEAANQALRPRPIPVRAIEDIPVNAIEGLPQPIRVRNLNEPGRLIQEVTGDATTATPNPLIQKIAEDTRATALRDAAFDEAKTAPRPNPAIEGVTPRVNPVYNLDEAAIKSAQDDAIDAYAAQLRDLGEGNGVQMVPDGEGGYIRTSNNYRPGMGTGKISKAAWREEAERQLRSGKADPAIQKAFDDAADPEVQSLLARGEPVDVPEGRPIQVKQANSIPVTDETVVPTGLPETPGTVRATTQTSPMQGETVAAANAPVVARPAQLPAETQAILDNPKQYTKRQVAAARNQRKLARQLAKTQEETAAAAERINTASPAAASPEGYVATGEFGRSVNGGAYQKVSRAAEMSQAIEETANMSPGDILQTARKNQATTGGFDPRDMRNIRALAQSKRLVRGTPEWNEMRQILKEDGTIWGQQGALRNYTLRRTASADELVNRYESKIYRLADDPTKIDGKWFDEVEAAETVYADARDEAMRAYNAFTENPTSANAKAYHAAQDAADKADKAAKTTEYKVADKALKGNKDVKQIRELEKMANDADLYQMDAVDASMLSGTGTFVRNTVNAAVGGAEESLFGGVASRISRLLTRENVGGGVGRGTLSGFGQGTRNIVDASKARANNAGWNPLAHIKNWATTGNQLGDTIIDSQVTHNVLDHYTQLLKEQGYKGRELVDRASVMARQDPDQLAKTYQGAARTAAGLGSGITRNNKIETIVKNMISDGISLGKPNAASEATAKLITRMTIGFPTAIGRSTAEGVKRFTLGAPTFIKALRSSDPVERALLIKEGIKQAGTGGMVVPPLFYAMGNAGLITGAYPSDPEERARWEREGISENSIKIGGAYYQLPAYLGAWAVPGLFYASLGRNDGDWSAAAADTAKAVPAILPTDNISNWLDVINGRSDPTKFITQTAASATRAATPGGAALAELAKMFDPTKNDTNSGDALSNFVDKVFTGIPGASNTVPNKEDDAGNVIQNPNPAAIALGASSAVQGAGEQRSAEITANVNSEVQKLTDLGVLGDPNLEGVLDDKEKQILRKFKEGKKLGEGDLKKLQDAFVKGVSTTGDDTAYLEREQYDTNLAALKLKKQLMEADKTVKPSDIKKMDTAIKRGELYKENEIPYDMIEAYQSTGIDEWRKMGDPEDDEYDPDMYQKLWDIDQLMTKAGVSYKKGALDKNKFYAKEKKGGSGSGRSRASELSSDFGTLKAGQFAPSLRAYETIDQKTGSVPVIRTVRPNIVHKIGSSG